MVSTSRLRAAEMSANADAGSMPVAGEGIAAEALWPLGIIHLCPALCQMLFQKADAALPIDGLAQPQAQFQIERALPNLTACGIVAGNSDKSVRTASLQAAVKTEAERLTMSTPMA